MKIGIVGTCTSWGVGIAMRQLREDAEVIAFEAVVPQRANKLGEASEKLLSCDVVFTHYLPETYKELATQEIKQRHKNVFLIPNVTFTGFHPDAVYISHSGIQVASPLAAYNSAIAAAAFSLGMDIDETEALYTAKIFAQLGYFDEFEKARTYLDRMFHTVGLVADQEWDSWVAQSPFMHTVNHPKPVVVGSVAKLCAVQAGLVSKGTKSPAPVYDTLAVFPIWPVYPDLGRHLGISGSFLFKPSGGPNIQTGQSMFLGLRQFLEGSFARYGTHQRVVFSVPSVKRVADILQKTAYASERDGGPS